MGRGQLGALLTESSWASEYSTHWPKLSHNWRSCLKVVSPNCWLYRKGFAMSSLQITWVGFWGPLICTENHRIQEYFINMEHVNTSVIACMGNLFFFTVELCSVILLYHNLLTHSPAEGYLVALCLKLLWTKPLWTFMYRILCEWRRHFTWVNNEEWDCGVVREMHV